MLRAIVVAILSTVSLAGWAEVMLYDASLGTLPNEQDWLAVSYGGVPQVTHTGTATRLDTSSSSSIQSGYFSEDPLFGGSQHPLIPVLDREAGFSINFTLQVLAETHASRDDNEDGLLDRAGFSLIAISEDLRGVELAFFTDRIWAYEDGQSAPADLFTQAEGVGFDTINLVNYRLLGTPGGYSLFADKVRILSGGWRQYDASILFPYDNPSSLFFGDDTSSASSDILLGGVSVSIGPFPTQVPIPIPPPALMICALIVLRKVGPRRRSPIN